MVMVLVVPVEELSAEAFGVLDAAEARREARLIFQGFEVAFRERVVVGRVRPVMRSGDTEIGQRERRGLRLYRSAAIGVRRELTRAIPTEAFNVRRQDTTVRNAA